MAALQHPRQDPGIELTEVSNDRQHCRMRIGRAVPGETRGFGSEARAIRVTPHELALAHTVGHLGGVHTVREHCIGRLVVRGELEHSLHGFGLEPEVFIVRQRPKIRVNFVLQKIIHRSIQELKPLMGI